MLNDFPGVTGEPRLFAWKTSQHDKIKKKLGKFSKNNTEHALNPPGSPRGSKGPRGSRGDYDCNLLQTIRIIMKMLINTTEHAYTPREPKATQRDPRGSLLHFTAIHRIS